MSINGKMIRNIVIAVVVLGLLGGLYFWAVKWQPESETEDGTASETIEIFSMEPEDILSVDFKNEDGEFSVVCIGEGEQINWSIPKYPDIEFSQAKLQSAVFGITGVYAVKEIGGGFDNLEEFGLAEEKNTVTIRGNDGSECTLILGDSVVVDDTFYLMKKGENKIYTVSSYTASHIMKKSDDFRETNLGSIDSSLIQEFSVIKGGQRVMELRKITNSEELSRLDMTDIVMTYPYDAKISSDRIEELFAPFTTAIEVVEFVSDDLNKRSDYGLDKGYNVIVSDGAKTHSLTFGNKTDNGLVYTIYNDNKFIFTMTSALLDAVKAVKPFDLIQKFAHIYSIDDVKSIEIISGEKTHTLTVEKVDEDKNDYTIDGKTTEEDRFKKVYQAVIGLCYTDVVRDRSKVSDEMCRIIFKMNDGKVNTAIYRKYDERNVMVTCPDGKEYLMLEKYVTEMINKIEEK